MRVDQLGCLAHVGQCLRHLERVLQRGAQHIHHLLLEVRLRPQGRGGGRDPAPAPRGGWNPPVARGCARRPASKEATAELTATDMRPWVDTRACLWLRPAFASVSPRLA